MTNKEFKIETKNVIPVELTKSMVKNKLEAFIALKYLKENNITLHNKIMNIIEEEVLLLLNYDCIYNYLVDDYMNNNKDRSKGANDFRSPEQVKYNHLIGYVWECILQGILEYKGFKVFRVGCDNDILNAKYTISNLPDLEVLSASNEFLLVDAQKADFNNNNNKFRVKASKLKGLLKNGKVIITWIGIDEGKIKYTSLAFNNINDINNKKYTYLTNGIGGKPTYEFTINTNDIRIL